jgi:hypothetical protein
MFHKSLRRRTLTFVSATIFMVMAGMMIAINITSSRDQVMVRTTARINLAAPAYRKLASTSTTMRSVPSTIPAGGVTVLGGNAQRGGNPVLMYLDPATSVTGMISQAEAGADALAIDNGPGLSVTNAVLASVTLPSDVPPAGVTPSPSAVIGTTAWVVTVTSPAPVSMSTCSVPGSSSNNYNCAVVVSNNYMVLDPTTGAFLVSTFG